MKTIIGGLSRKMLSIVVSVVVSLSIALIGSFNVMAEETSNRQASSDSPNRDAWIATRIKSVLLLHRNVSGVKTDVDVKDGVATLRGQAETQAQKDLTTKYAEDVDGVKKVRNQMTVVPMRDKSNQSAQKPKNQLDDAGITAQVKTALLYHRSTSALRTNVSTTNGVVTVTGAAKNAAEKDLVTQLVSDINGVKDVVNNMTIESGTNSQG